MRAKVIAALVLAILLVPTAAMATGDSGLPTRLPRHGVVQTGPPSGKGPPEDQYYFALQNGDCVQLYRQLIAPNNHTDELFGTLAALCVAATTKTFPADWTAAQGAYDDSADLTDCLSVSARRSLGRALQNHARTGKKRPNFDPIPGGTACPPTLTYVGVATSQSGPGLVLLGRYLFGVDQVTVNGRAYAAGSENVGQYCARVYVLGLQTPAAGATVSLGVDSPGFHLPVTSTVLASTYSEDALASIDPSTCLP